MLKEFSSYPVIRTTRFSETVGFYEDLFGLVPFSESEGYVRLRHKDSEDVALTILDARHDLIPKSLHQADASHIFSFVVKDVDALFDTIYMEGLEIIKDVTEVEGGIRHFLFADPHNNIIINIMNHVVQTPDTIFKIGSCSDKAKKTSGGHSLAGI